MTLEKPKDEECRNCYYCLSFTTEKHSGFFSDNIELVETFLCRRNAPLQADMLRSAYGPREFKSKECKVDKDYWCGEWRKRE